MQASTQPESLTFPLWTDGAPGSEHWTQLERTFTTPPGAPVAFKQVRNVTQPTMTAFLPSAALSTGADVIVCSGGGYHTLAFDHESD